MKVRMVLLLGCLFVHPSLWAQDSAMDAIIQKIETRMAGYEDYDAFTVSVVSSQKTMDGAWNPKKVVVVDKTITQQGEVRREDILRATQTEKGTTRDITEKYREEQRKREEKKNKETEGDDGKNGERGRVSLGEDEMFPFGPNERSQYTFDQLPDTVVSGRLVYVLQTRAKEKSKELYEGNYYVDQETYDVLMVDLRPSKNPKFVRQMRMKMWFGLLSDHYVVERTWMRIYAGFLLKKIRMEVEETYTDYRIPPDAAVDISNASEE